MKGFIKSLCFIFFSFAVVIFAPSFARAQTVDLADYIAGVGFITHSLSTGEQISFTGEGAPGPGAPVRQIKGGNYEQFFIAGDGVYRREDTSWAPLPGFQPAHCTSGEEAVDTVGACRSYTNGEILHDDGQKWTPRTAAVGDVWSDHFSIVPVGRPGTLAGSRNFCTLSDATGYPTACTETKIQFAAYYGADAYTFCTGSKNPEPMIKLYVVAGPGTGDTFFYMKNYGLVGFDAPGFEAGFMGAGADASKCENNGANAGGIRVTIRGTVRVSGLCTDEIGHQISNCYINGAVLKAYQGNALLDSGKDDNGRITNPVFGAWTISGNTQDPLILADRPECQADPTLCAGYFRLVTFYRPGKSYANSNYVAVGCGGLLADLYRIDISKGDINNLNIKINCGQVVAPIDLPDSLGYVNKNGLLSCFNENISGADGGGRADSLEETVDLQQKDSRFQGAILNVNQSPPNPDTGDYDYGQVPPSTTIRYTDAIDFRYTTWQSLDLNTIAGLFSAAMGAPFKYLMKPWEGNPLPKQLPTADDIRRCNSTFAEVGDPNRNTYLCHNVASNLRDTADAKARYEYRARTEPKFLDMEIFDAGGTKVKMKEVAPPWLDNTVGALCPPNIYPSTCDPLNPGYKYDDTYFPYWDLYTPEFEKASTRIVENTWDTTDSCVADADTQNRSTIFNEVNSHDLLVGENPCREEVVSRVPAGDNGWFSLPKLWSLVGKTTPPESNLDPAPVDVLADPYTPDVNPDLPYEKDATGISTERRVFRIGLMDSLCTCNDITDPSCSQKTHEFLVKTTDLSNNNAVVGKISPPEAIFFRLYLGHLVLDWGAFFQAILGFLRSIFPVGWGTDPNVQCIGTHPVAVSCSLEDDGTGLCASVGDCPDANKQCGGDKPAHCNVVADSCVYEQVPNPYSCDGVVTPPQPNKFKTDFMYKSMYDFSSRILQAYATYADPFTPYPNASTFDGNNYLSTKLEDNEQNHQVDSNFARISLDLFHSISPSFIDPVRGLVSAVGILGTSLDPNAVCDPDAFAALLSGGHEAWINDMPGNSVARSLTTNLLGLDPMLQKIYATVATATGVPCEVLAGIHYAETGNSMDPASNPFQNLNGAPATLLDGAFEAAELLKSKVGGSIDTFDKLLTAISYYNGGGNANCDNGVKYASYNGPCHPPVGIDDPYVTNKIDSVHMNMYLRYCADYTTCEVYCSNNPGAFGCPAPVRRDLKAGALTAAIIYHLKLTGGL